MKNVIIPCICFILSSLYMTGCGGGGNSGENTTSPTEQTNVAITISGAVNDAPIPFANVKLLLHPDDKLLATLTSDINGEWSCTLYKNSIPKDRFIIISATNPANNALIRSVIDTDDILVSDSIFSSEETTVSHYTEAALAMAEINSGINQNEVDKIKSLIRLDNKEPTPTGLTALDELATVIQHSFDDINSSADKLNLLVYEKLLEDKVLEVLPDEYGKVTLQLPISYNDKIYVDANISTGSHLDIIDNTITFFLTPQEVLTDVNLTIKASLNRESITRIVTLYAKGNSKKHYIYRAVAPSINPSSAQKTLLINGQIYTIVAYSFINIYQSNATTESIDINGFVRNKAFQGLSIAGNYTNSKILLKVYEGGTLFDETSFVGESEIITLSSNQKIDIANIAVTRINDFRPIAPKDTAIEMPPAAPHF